MRSPVSLVPLFYYQHYSHATYCTIIQQLGGKNAQGAYTRCIKYMK